jgi:hypothetical protein
MADTPHPSLHIDDDWKRQAQEEKRKLAEAEAAKKAASAPAPAPGASTGLSGGPEAASGPAAGRRARRGADGEMPQASFGYLVQSVMTQALFYLGELGTRSGQTSVDLDMARLQIDLLGVLEEKTRGNISADEQRLLDSALYEVRMRFVAVAREYVEIGQR